MISKSHRLWVRRPLLDKVADKEAYVNEPLKFNKHTDRIYSEPEEYSLLRDDGWARTIEIHHYHNSDVVCWNPWAELSCSMDDMPNNGYKQMVCVETARINVPMKVKHNTLLVFL